MSQDTNVTGQQGSAPSAAQRVQNAVALLGTASETKPATVGIAEGGIVPPELTPPKPATEPKPEPTFRDAVAKMRQDREARARQQEQEAHYVAENRRLQEELQAVRSHGSFEDDPVGYAQSRKWTPDQQLMYAKSLLFDLRPDQADPDFRIKMFEQKQAREKSKEKAQAEEARQRQDQDAARQEFQRYTASMEEAVMSFDAGSYPESEAWYGDDAQSYLRDMLSTAFKLANEAQSAGTQADLRPQAVAAKLEADMAARAAARDKRRTVRQPSDSAGQVRQMDRVVQDAEQSVIDTPSSKNLSGGGSALPPARTDSERIQRAVAAGFRNR